MYPYNVSENESENKNENKNKNKNILVDAYDRFKDLCKNKQFTDSNTNVWILFNLNGSKKHFEKVLTIFNIKECCSPLFDDFNGKIESYENVIQHLKYAFGQLIKNSFVYEVDFSDIINVKEVIDSMLYNQRNLVVS